MTPSDSPLLVVDDNEDNRYTLVQRLKRLGYTDVATATDGRQALALLRERPFDLVLLDVMMPEMDGYQVLEHLRADAKLRHVPVIMISAVDQLESVVRCIELGAEDYLAKPFNPTLLRARVGASLEKKRLRDAVAAALDRLERELSSAREVQLSMVPAEFPAPTPARPVEIAATLEPAREIGGDLYDFFWGDDGRLNFVVADVSDKGAPAALFMARAKTALRVAAMLAPAAPHEVVARVNAELCVDNAHGMFVTLFLGVLDPASGALAFCNAGHNPPYLVNRAGGVVPIQGPRGKPLGIRPTFAYQTGELRLAPEERLFLFTDGITEAMDAAGELFGEERLEAALRSHSDAPAEAMVREVVGAVRAFAGTAPQADDIAALALRLARLNWLERRLASRRADLPRVGELVDELAVAHRLPPAALVDLRIALDEVVANIVEHGRAREIRLRLGVHDGLLEAIVEDDGTPFDPRTAPPPDLDRPLAERRVGGLGLHFVRNLIAEVDYSSRPGVNRLVLRQPLTTTTPRENDGSA